MPIKRKSYCSAYNIKSSMLTVWKGSMSTLLLLAGCNAAYANVDVKIVNETRCQVSDPFTYPRDIASSDKANSVRIYYYSGRYDNNLNHLRLAGVIEPNSRVDSIPYVDDAHSKTGGHDGVAIVVSLQPPADGVHPDSSTISTIGMAFRPAGHSTYWFAQGRYNGKLIALNLVNPTSINKTCNPDAP